MNTNESSVKPEIKLEWVRPELQRIEAGSAESNFANVNDGSGQQTS